MSIERCLSHFVILFKYCTTSENSLPVPWKQQLVLWELSLWGNHTGATARNTHVTARQQWPRYPPCCLRWGHDLRSSCVSCFLEQTHTVACVRAVCLIWLYNKYHSACRNVWRQVCPGSPSAQGASGHLETVHEWVCFSVHVDTHIQCIQSHNPVLHRHDLWCSLKSCSKQKQPWYFNWLDFCFILFYCMLTITNAVVTLQLLALPEVNNSIW